MSEPTPWATSPTDAPSQQPSQEQTAARVPASEVDVPPSWAVAAGPQAPLVLDASFVLAVLDNDPQAMSLVRCLRGSVLPAPTLGEVFYKVAEHSGLPPAEVAEVLRASGVRLVDLPAAAAHHFPELRRIDATRRAATTAAGQRRANLSLGDLCVLGYALHAGLPVLTGDRHWATLSSHGLQVAVHLYQRP